MSESSKNGVNPFAFSTEDVIGLLNDRPEELLALFTQFSARYLHIGQLGVERNTFINWEKGGLIPYERGEKGWRKFSFLEAVWIKTLEEMRALGISTDTIRIVKDALWKEGQDDFYELMLDSIKQAASKGVNLPDGVIEQLEQIDMSVMKRELSALQVSPLMFFVVVSLIRRVSYVLAVNKDQEITLLPLMDPTKPDAHQSVGKAQAELFAISCTVINLGNILRELAFQSDIVLSEDVLFSVLSPTERRILELVKEKHYSEIVVQMDKEGEPTVIKVTKRVINEEVIKNLHAYTKKGSFQNISFKTKDGQIIHFEETDVIKLETSRKRGQPRKNA